MYLNMSQSSQLQLPEIMLTHVCVYVHVSMQTGATVCRSKLLALFPKLKT